MLINNHEIVLKYAECDISMKTTWLQTDTAWLLILFWVCMWNYEEQSTILFLFALIFPSNNLNYVHTDTQKPAQQLQEKPEPSVLFNASLTPRWSLVVHILGVIWSVCQSDMLLHRTCRYKTDITGKHCVSTLSLHLINPFSLRRVTLQQMSSECPISSPIISVNRCGTWIGGSFPGDINTHLS